MININLFANLLLCESGAVNAPFLTVDLSNPADPVVNWTWTGAVPDGWQIYTSVDAGVTWVDESSILGSLNSWHVSPDKLVYVVGTDGSSAEITPHSNIVDTTATGDGAAGLTDDDGNVLTDDDGNVLTADQ